MPFFDPPNIQQLVAEGNVAGLIKALGQDQETSVRMEAAKSLGRIGASEAIEPLATAMDDDDRQVRLSAVTALGKIGIPAIHSLMTALKNEDDEMRRQAAQALQLIDVPVARLLLSVLKDDDPYAWVKATVATVLEVRQDSDEKGMHYSQKGQRSRAIFFQLPLSRRTCPQCKIARDEHNAWKVVGEVAFPGILKLECPRCGHIGVFLPH